MHSLTGRFLRCVRLSVLLILFLVSVGLAAPSAADVQRWHRFAGKVTITRDDWGIAHVVGKTDADTVFGAIYAQAEDDFNRVETNYINAMGRLAETEGESEIYRDLRMKLFIDPDELRREYTASPRWLQRLMDAWADGLNFYLSKHPDVHPRVISQFEPWMALSFTEGSIGGDIETINLAGLQRMYGDANAPVAEVTRDDELIEKEPSGSNGIAIAPKNTIDGHALLLINPHTSFYFRSELQMTSGEGLNAYGASTWGQFFIYQGFNEHCGWMHTSSAVDAIDEFSEKVSKKGDGYVYRHGDKDLPVTARVITVPYKTANGQAERKFTVYYTMHGPVVRRADDGSWVSISLMKKHIDALTQSYIRTKSKSYKDYRKAMELFGNSSNNTIYADAAGHIAYFHGNYIPRRDPKFDWTKPVDGSDPATDYKGLLKVDEAPNLYDPASGWLYNSNDWPWEAAGPSSRKQSAFPKYVDSGVPSARGKHAVKVLENKKDFSLEGLRAAAYDSYLTWFDRPLPALIKAWDSLPDSDALKQKTKDPIAVLRAWDQRWRVDSVPTSVAIYWAQQLQRTGVGRQSGARTGPVPVVDYITTQATPQELLTALVGACDKLTADFGKWNTPWGEINRFQRLTDDIVHPFTDAGPSIPVGFTSATWGSLASFGAAPYKGSKKIYGTSGNSFVAVVEFGPKVRAIAVTAGGESGNVNSKHFNDQAERYATGNLRPVYYYPEQLKGHTERVYKPGE